MIRTSKSDLKRLEIDISNASNYEDWHSLAHKHDKLTGKDEWRSTTNTALYDYSEIKKRFDALHEKLNEGNAQEVLYCLNEGIHGNMGGMGNPSLYSQAKSGTKQLIDNYVSCLENALTFIRDCPKSEISRPDKLNFFQRASRCYGRSALLMSGGAGLIYFHHGVAQELTELDLLPSIISGSSAGSVVSAQLGTLTDDELRNDYFTQKRYQEVNNTGLLDLAIGKISKEDAKVARESTLDEFIANDITFREAYEKTGRYINISISPNEKQQTSRLMNAITSPDVYVRSAVSASSSIPGIMPSERLYAKGADGKPRRYLSSRRWVDGSFSGDIPKKRLSRLYGVNHFIVSLINPMMIPFVRDHRISSKSRIKSILSEYTSRLLVEILTDIEKSIYKIGYPSNQAVSKLSYLNRVIDQNYIGDVNIFLPKSHFKWRQTIFKFQGNEIENLINKGKENTRDKVAMLNNSMKISKLLDKTLEDLNCTL